MKVVKWYVIISALITACTSPSIPHPTITPKNTLTEHLKVETLTPTHAVAPTITAAPTDVGKDDLQDGDLPKPTQTSTETYLLPVDLPENYSLSEYNFKSGELVTAIRNADGDLIYIKNEDEWEKVFGDFIIEKGKDWTDTHESIDEVLDACFTEAQTRFGDVSNFKPTQSEGSRSVPPSTWNGTALGGYDLKSDNYSDFYGHFWFEGFFQVGTESDYILCMPLVYVDGDYQPHRLMGYFGEVMDNNKSMQVGGRAEDIGISGATVKIDDFINEFTPKLKGWEAIFPISLDIEGGLGLVPTYPITGFTRVLSELFLNYRYGQGWKKKPPEERGEGPFYENYVNLLEKINQRLPLTSEDVKILLPSFAFSKVPRDADFVNNR